MRIVNSALFKNITNIDDISIIDPPDEISKAIKLVNSEAPNFGLKLNLNK